MKKIKRKWPYILTVLFIIISPGWCVASSILQAIYWTSPVMDQAVVPDVAKFDLVIADLENWVNNPESLKNLKILNPNLKLLMYANPMELFYKRLGGRGIGWQLYQMVKDPPYDKWWFKTTKEENIVFYKQLPMRMMNLSTDCPEVGGTRWNQYFAQFLIEKLFIREPVPDGFFG